MKLKNYLALALCILLLVPVAISVLPQPTVAGGAGNGVDEQVKTLKKTADIVEFVAERLSNMGSGRQTYLSEGSEEPVFTSATWRDETSMSVGGMVRMDREMTVYLTESASYYISEGDMFMGNGSIKFKLHIYISSARVLIKIEKWDISASLSAMAGSDYELFAQFARFKNKWIDCTSDRTMSTAFQAVSQYNNESLTAMAEYFRQNKDNFTKDGEIYDLQPRFFTDFFQCVAGVSLGGISGAGLPGLGDIRGDFMVDLSAVTSPVLAYTMDCDLFHGYEKFTFENINNTVIFISEDVETVPFAEVMGELQEG